MQLGLELGAVAVDVVVGVGGVVAADVGVDVVDAHLSLAFA